MEVAPSPARLLESNVKHVHIRLTPKRIGQILNIPFTGASLSDIEMNDHNIIHSMLKEGDQIHAGMFTNSLTPNARIIGRIISHNILQKTGSFTYMSLDLAKCIYAIMGNIGVNWARVIYDTMTKPISTNLPFGCFLTRIFESFGVSFDQETDVLRDAVFFDKFALKRMGIPFEPQQMEEEEEEEGEQEEEEEEEDEEYQPSPPVAPQASGSSFNPSEVLERLDNLSLDNRNLQASHYVMQYQVSRIRETQEEMQRKQEEMYRSFYHYFPPPPE